MKYLDEQQLDDFDHKAFRALTPYPWCNPTGILTAHGFDLLTSNMPEEEQFRGFFGKQRKHGQRSHDRYILDYEEGMAAPQPWLEFIDELKSPDYRKFVANLLGVRAVRFRFHWHYTPTACEVSPHCDSGGKLGNQIFYMNTNEDWQDHVAAILDVVDLVIIDCTEATKHLSWEIELAQERLGNENVLLFSPDGLAASNGL